MHISKRVKRVSRLLFGLILVLVGLFLVAQWSPSWVKNLPLDIVLIGLGYSLLVWNISVMRKREERSHLLRAYLAIVEAESSLLKQLDEQSLADQAGSLARVMVCIEQYHTMSGVPRHPYFQKSLSLVLARLSQLVPDKKDREVLLGQAHREVKQKLTAPATVVAPLN